MRAILTTALLVAHFSVVSSVVTIDDNGYRGVSVVISSQVPDDPQLVDHIKELFISGSSFLFEATRHRAYFNEVTIVVPADWEPRDEYEVIRRSGVKFSTADVRIDFPNAVYGNAPYTLQPGGCGESGDYIHLTPDFVNSLATSGKSAYGDPGRALVHEWAHLRYGVFDEHGYHDDSRTPAFYRDEDGKIKHTSCTSDVPGWLRDKVGESCRRGPDGLPDANCFFYPDVENAHAKASLMSMPYLPTVDSFCDDSSTDRRHNALAPNMQNLMCHGRSTWAVLMDHADFVNDRNTERTAPINPLPLFRVVQPKKNDNPTFVLVLDVSFSMRGRRMDLLHKAAARFIKYQLADFSSLGMIKFSSDVTVLSNITVLDKLSKNALVDKVPVQEDEGYTAIGQGILEGLKLLRSNREPTEGSMLLLVTDGEENEGPKIEEVLPHIKDSRVTINTIAFGTEASRRLEMLVKATGGRGFFFDDQKVGHKALDSAFLESATTQADIELQPVEVVNKYWLIEAGQELSMDFTLDKKIGTNTRLLLTYDYLSTIQLALVAPNGTKYDSRSRFYTDDTNTNTIYLQFAEAQPGRWSVITKNYGELEQDLALTVTSEARNIREQPIRVRAWVADVDLTFPAKAKVFAEVKKEYNAIIDASVVATIDGPNSDPHIMMLYDNGIGADTVSDDGIYSGYFTNFNGSGRYSVEAVVANNGKARMKLGSRSSATPRYLHLPADKVKNQKSGSSFTPDNLLAPEENHAERLKDYIPVEDFERAVTAGSFRVDDWIPGDFIPPDRVRDLQLSTISYQKVELAWTSPADNDDQNASVIDLRYHIHPETLVKSFDEAWVVDEKYVLKGNLSNPPSSGQIHKVEINLQLPRLNSSTAVYFALRAEDVVGNRAETSNVLQVPLNTKAPVEKKSYPVLHVVLGVVGVLLAVLVIVGIVLFVRAKKRQQKYRCKHQHKLLSTPS